MVLAFYSVDGNYGRYSFDGYNTNAKEDCIEIVKKLSEGSYVRYYDMGTDSQSTMASFNRNEFVNDYNDEMLDGGYWCICLNAISDSDIAELNV